MNTIRRWPYFARWQVKFAEHLRPCVSPLMLLQVHWTEPVWTGGSKRSLDHTSPADRA